MPMTLETEPLAADQAGQVAAAEQPAATTNEAAETEVRIFDGDDEAAATNPVDETDAGPITSQELAEGATGDVPQTISVNDSKPVGFIAGDSAATKLREITQASRDVTENRERVALLKDELKTAKEDLQGSINRLMRLTAAVTNDAARPLLAAAEAKAEPTAESASGGDETPANPGETEVSSPSPSAKPTADAWRAYRLDDPNHFPELASQKALVAKLAEAEIETIGQMVDFQSTGKDLTDIKGIGTGKADKIADALETFWRENPELVDAAADES